MHGDGGDLRVCRPPLFGTFLFMYSKPFLMKLFTAGIISASNVVYQKLLVRLVWCYGVVRLGLMLASMPVCL